MDRDQRLVAGVASVVAVVAVMGAVGATLSSHAVARQVRQQAEAQEALIASLTAELEAVRRDRARPAPEPRPIPVAVSPATPQPAAAPAADDMAEELARRERETARLLERIAELEADRARREERSEAAADRMQAWRERRQQQDPEAAERRRQAGREVLSAAADTTRDRLLFMQAVPTDGLSPDYLDNHHALLERLTYFDDTMQRIAADPEDPANRELMPELFANMRGLDDMLRMQRDVLLDDLARDIGYEGEAAGQFVEAINTITEMTTMPGPGLLRRGMGGGMRGRGGE